MPGTRFPTVSLEDLNAQKLQPENGSHRPVVLVVDDEPIIADTLVAILSGQGYVVDAAYNGESALEMARLLPPELLISDVLMPGMSGVSLAITVRELYPDCRVLLFSGQAATVDILLEARKLEDRKLGYDFKILGKPIHPQDLLDHAARLLHSAR